MALLRLGFVLLSLCMAMASSFEPAWAATARPFPFHVVYTPGAIRPTNATQAQMDAAVLRHYRAWKTAYLRNLGGGEYWVKYDDTNSTVSEAHGYGMVLTAYMADKAIFDSMFRYYKAHPSFTAPHLMAWKQTLRNGAMVNVEGGDSATDGDLDIAYALLLAHVQWSSTGAIHYRQEALLILHDILAHEVKTPGWNLTPGDWAEGPDTNHTRPSDFMTGHMLAFAKTDSANAAKWGAVHARIAQIVNYQLAHGSNQTGLMPDFMVLSGGNFVPTPGRYLETRHDGDFSYNACRTPWRLPISYLTLGRSDMLAVFRKQTSWIKQKTGGLPSRIKAGYFVRNGVNGASFVNFSDLAFTAPFAVVAMTGGSDAQVWLNRLWTSITGGDFGVNEDYFGDSIRLQVLLTVSGNWWQP